MNRALNKRPLVSILTPSYNQGRFLRDCLDSVAAQTYQTLEHIVVDGGSTDETLSVLEAAVYPVRWVSEPDRGQAHALNKALAMSSGEIIGWLNSDDAYFKCTSVESAVRILQRCPQVDIVFGDSFMVDENKIVLRHIRSFLPDWTRLAPLFSPISQPAAFMRMSALDRLSSFLREDLHVALDLELWLRLHRNGAVFRHAAMPFAVDRDYRERKVRTLQAIWEQESVLLTREYGIRFEIRADDAVWRWARRIPGVLELWRARSDRQSAIQLCFPKPARAARRQLFLSQSAQRQEDQTRLLGMTRGMEELDEE